MKKRAITSSIDDLCFANGKIALVSGPRQSGKTTLAKMMLGQRRAGVYQNWDDMKFKRRWVTDPSSVVPTAQGKTIPLLVLDEVHKHYRWKGHLKGIYDTLETPCDILVTGSARLNIYRRRSDSMVGRYFHFRLHPFSLRELERPKSIPPDQVLDSLFTRSLRRRKAWQDNLDSMMVYGPFPEPLLKQDERLANLWRNNRNQLVIREDLRDISRLPELGEIELLAALIPEIVGSPFSMASIGRDILRPIPTVRRWLDYLKEVYFTFEVKPYNRKIARSLRKEGKVYLWDFGSVPNKAARFENLVASHLLKACHYWTDNGFGVFELFYLRNKDKQELDFLVVRDKKPWLPVEVKLSDTDPSGAWGKFAPQLGCGRGVQLVLEPEWQLHEHGDTTILVAGAAEVLNYFV